MVCVLLTALFLLGLLAAPSGVDAAADAAVAWRWAPVIYQQDNGNNPLVQENGFTEVNYDLDWQADNKGDNSLLYKPTAAVYYSLVESDTHYYIGYYLYRTYAL